MTSRFFKISFMVFFLIYILKYCLLVYLFNLYLVFFSLKYYEWVVCGIERERLLIFGK